MSIASMMNTTCNVETNAGSKNSSGLSNRTWTVAASGLPCRVNDLDDKTVLEYARLGYEATSVFYFATDPGLAGHEANSRIVWNGNAYYTQKVNNQGGQLNRLWKVVAVKKPLEYSTTG